jgi:multidrug efflux pump subunit AcrA (membrane-fusion protein)
MFRIHGFADREFLGTITKMNPAANATTRQVEVLVSFADPTQRPEVSGLYAEGRIETRSTTALTIPATALVRDGDQAYAWRLDDGALHKVSIAVGDRDPRSGEFALAGGVTEGDQLVRYPTSTLRDGQAVELAARATAATLPGAQSSVTSAGK